jgi:hypothetical protein
MRVHDVARRDVCRWIARCHGLAGAIDAGLLGRHQQESLLLLVNCPPVFVFNSEVDGRLGEA